MSFKEAFNGLVLFLLAVVGPSFSNGQSFAGSPPPTARLTSPPSSGALSNGGRPPPSSVLELSPPPPAFIPRDLPLEKTKYWEGLTGWKYWSARDSQIIDLYYDEPVRFAGVTWAGFDSKNAVVHGLHVRSYKSHIEQMAKDVGFNLLRLTFTGSLFKNPTPRGINYTMNPDLEGLNSFEIMDKIVYRAFKNSMRVIFAQKKVGVNTSDEWGLWYDKDYPDEVWIKNWVTLAQRYANNPTVVGLDLFNAVKNSSGGNPLWQYMSLEPDINWRFAAERCAQAIQKVNKDVIVFVSGMEGHGKGPGFYRTWPGQDCIGIRSRFILNLTESKNKWAFSVQEFGPQTGIPQPWFEEQGFPDNMPTRWFDFFGFLIKQPPPDPVPMYISAWGTRYNETEDNFPVELSWAFKLVNYIRDLKVSWVYDMWTPDSNTTGGLLLKDYLTLDQDKARLFDTIKWYIAPVVYDTPELPPAPPFIAKPPPPLGFKPNFNVSLGPMPPEDDIPAPAPSPAALNLTSLFGNGNSAYVRRPVLLQQVLCALFVVSVLLCFENEFPSFNLHVGR